MVAFPDPSSSHSYAGALRRLMSLADYERMVGLNAPALKYDLRRMRELAERMGNPQGAVPVIHVAGTKGKGSVATTVSSILTAAGLRVGTFTSPHLHTFRERIRVDGEPSTESRFAAALERVWPHVDAMAAESAEGRPSTFEALTAMAFDLPRTEGVDVLVLEVGLGGRLDSTNVADAAVDIITSISIDHTAILGATLAEIAGEKAGIVKSAVPLIVAPQPAEAMSVIEERAREVGATPMRLGDEITIRAREHDLSGQRFTVATPHAVYDLWSPLLGAHQQENTALAVAAAEALEGDLPHEAVVQGVRRVKWDGRFQVLSLGGRGGGEGKGEGEGPAVIADGAHNVDSARRLHETVETYVAPERTVLVFGCSRDKDFESMIAELARFADEVVVCASRHPRAMEPERVADAFERAGTTVRRAADVREAMAMAQAACGPRDLVLATGSLFIVAEAIEAWQGIEPERYPELDGRTPSAEAPATPTADAPSVGGTLP
jgi:dihydrofolate synthase/folylpolyglutamate synthase